MTILRASESVQALIMLNYSVEGRLYWQAQAAGTKILLKTRQSSQVCRKQRQGTNLSPIDREFTYVWAITCLQHFMTKTSLGRQEIYLTAVLKRAEVPNTALSFRDSTLFFFNCCSWQFNVLFFNSPPLSPLSQDTINNVKSRLAKSVQIQTLLRAFEARDRNIQESNYDRVNFWSTVNLFVMMLVSAVQVYLVRSLFEDKRKIYT